MKWSIPVISFLLACLSLITLRSIAPELVLRQFLYFVIGFIIFFSLRYVNFNSLRKPVLVGYWLLIITLVLLLIVGRDTRETVRWIDLFAGFKLQPSQFAPLITALFLSFYLPEFKKKRQSLDLLRVLGIIALPVILIFLQPDFGSSLVLAFSLAVVFFFVPVKFKHFLLMGAGFILLTLIAWNSILRPYQKARIISFFTPTQQQDIDAGYNARQALIAVGSGQLYGRGLGFGVQSHLRFLPERQTDFVFASIAEEWGFVGSFLLVSLFFSLMIILWKYSLTLKKERYQLFILVVVANLFLHVLINIGMNVGLMPITGLTLPLVSYGGSSIIAFMLSLGIVFNLIESQKPEMKMRLGGDF